MVNNNILISIIIFNLLFLSFPSKVYCDNWVYIGTINSAKLYYNESKIDISRKDNKIKVWVKYNKEIIEINGKFNGELELIMFDYGNWKYCTIEKHPTIGEIWGADNSGELSEIKWLNIIPESNNDKIINKIIRDYKIKH